MSVKKNNKHLINIIQEVGYLLLVANGKQDASSKKMMNQSMGYLKKEVKKLKRI